MVGIRDYFIDMCKWIRDSTRDYGVYEIARFLLWLTTEGEYVEGDLFGVHANLTDEELTDQFLHIRNKTFFNRNQDFIQEKLHSYQIISLEGWASRPEFRETGKEIEPSEYSLETAQEWRWAWEHCDDWEKKRNLGENWTRFEQEFDDWFDHWYEWYIQAQEEAEARWNQRIETEGVNLYGDPTSSSSDESDDEFDEPLRFHLRF